MGISHRVPIKDYLWVASEPTLKRFMDHIAVSYPAIFIETADPQSTLSRLPKKYIVVGPNPPYKQFFVSIYFYLILDGESYVDLAVTRWKEKITGRCFLVRDYAIS